jgi:hypothetical protein
MAPALVLAWFSALELVPFLVAIALAIAALVYNKALAEGLTGFTGGRWPPGGLIREDRPEKTEERRQLHQFALVMARIGVVLLSVFTLGACAAVLIDGPS